MAMFGVHAAVDGAAAAAAAPVPKRSSPCPGANLRPAATNTAAVADATLCLLDRVRAAAHLRALRSNRDLRALASGQVRSMVRWNYFADVRPSGQTPWSLISGTRYAHAARVSIGQDIAWGMGAYATPTQIVAAWMASPAHREVILTGGYRDAGVAVIARLPPRVGRGRGGATYAIELAARH